MLLEAGPHTYLILLTKYVIFESDDDSSLTMSFTVPYV